MLSFQKYWWLKNPAIRLDEKLLACNLTSRKFQIWSLNRKIKNWNIFQFSIFPTRNNDKTSRKLKKSLFWTSFEQFLLILGQTRHFFGEPASANFFFVFRFLLFCKISEKSNQPIVRETSYRQTDGRTDKHEFIGPPLLQESKIFQKHNYQPF